MEHSEKCPNCGRELTDEEMYCYFCELSVEELKKKDKKHSGNGHH
jgi:hypothetical protein